MAHVYGLHTLSKSEMLRETVGWLVGRGGDWVGLRKLHNGQIGSARNSETE